MKGKQILFVTYNDEKFDEGLSYAIDLARMMNKGMTILMVCTRMIMEKFEDLMTAVAFAEENEHEKARVIMNGDFRSADCDADEKLLLLAGKCKESGIDVSIHSTAMDTVSAIKDFLKQKKRIDMVLLNPNITDNGNISPRELNRIVKTLSSPIVTMTRQACAA